MSTSLLAVLVVAASLLAIPATYFLCKMLAPGIERTFFLLPKWAERNGLRILKKESRYFFRGPFFWNSSRHQLVYRITVEDPAGHRKNGWVCLGGWFYGPLFSDEVRV